MVKRFECLQLLSSWLDDETISITSLSGVAHEWTSLRQSDLTMSGLNMGLCMPFATGVSLAFPKRKVVALDGDGSLLLDTSSLVTLAEVNPPNMIAIVFDNSSYFSRLPTATAHGTDLTQMARGAGIASATTIETLGEFEAQVRPALHNAGLRFFVVKVERGQQPVESRYIQITGRPMKELFLSALRKLPDYPGLG